MDGERPVRARPSSLPEVSSVDTLELMTTEVISIGALVVSAFSAAVAVFAYLNARTTRRHQEHLDRRQREYRDVVWHGEWHADRPRPAEPVEHSFVLTNLGTTDARDVVLTMGEPGRAQVDRFASVGPGESVHCRPLPVGPPQWVNGVLVGDWDDPDLRNARPWRVHWSSPLGQADKLERPGLQVF